MVCKVLATLQIRRLERDLGQGPGGMLTGSGRGCSGHDVNGGNGGSGGRVAKCLQPGVWAPAWPWAAANMGLSCLLSGHCHPQLSGSRTRGQTTTPDYIGTNFHSVYIIHTSSCGTRTRSKLDTARHNKTQSTLPRLPPLTSFPDQYK